MVGAYCREMARESAEIAGYLGQIASSLRAVVDDPATYLGAAAPRTRAICDEWERKVGTIAI